MFVRDRHIFRSQIIFVANNEIVAPVTVAAGTAANQLTVYLADSKEIRIAHKRQHVQQIVTFGKFEQDNNKSNGSEPLKWYVCNKQSYNGRKLCYLLSLNVIHWMKFSEYDSGWSRSLVRDWLNNTFYNNGSSNSQCNKYNEKK